MGVMGVKKKGYYRLPKLICVMTRFLNIIESYSLIINCVIKCISSVYLHICSNRSNLKLQCHLIVPAYIQSPL